ncbi:hypothetical protein RND81_14G153300 [Saponaria officinalis]|uniref:Uncharacterized protein n=1 Tax=Saponaria officinalis TaxID=3572 RepID=A0AAW1GY84_SAPOF
MDFHMDETYDTSKAGTLGSLGTSLLEVFNVRINKNIKVYGTFSVEDHNGTFHFFNRDGKDVENGKVNGTLLSLTSPTQIIPAGRTIIPTGRTITFSVDLKDKCGNEFIEGSANVSYTIPIVGLGTTVKIQLIKRENESVHSDVNGSISARYGDNYHSSIGEDVKKNYEFMLFNKTCEDNPLQLKHEDYLPLSRSFVIVPAHSSIVIKLNLKIFHSDGRFEHLEGHEIEFLSSVYEENGSSIFKLHI